MDACACVLGGASRRRNASSNTMLSHGVRDEIVAEGERSLYALCMGADAMRLIVEPALDRRSSSAGACALESAEGQVTCTEGGRVRFILQDRSLTVYARPNQPWLPSPEHALLPLVRRAWGCDLMLHVRRGWVRSDGGAVSKQIVHADFTHLIFNHSLSELGLPAWVPRDMHPLTMHLVLPADNTAAVDESITADPRAFLARAHEALGLHAEPAQEQPALAYVRDSLWNRAMHARELGMYKKDKMERNFLYSR